MSMMLLLLMEVTDMSVQLSLFVSCGQMGLLYLITPIGKKKHPNSYVDLI